MELTQLKYFFAVYESLNYSKVSDQLHVSRQAISQSIKNLEHEFGGKLFVVSKNKIFPTKLAIELYDSCQPLIAQLTRKENELKNRLANKTELKVGVCASLLPFFVPEMEDYLKGFKEAYPHTDLILGTYNGDDLFMKFDNDELDAIVTMYMPRDNEVDQVHVLHSFPFGITIGPNDPLNERDSVSLRDLYGLTSTCMDSKLRTMSLLKDALDKKKIKVNFQVVYKALDAYQLMDNNGYIMFNGINRSQLLDRGNKDLPIKDFNHDWDLCIIHKHTTNELNELIEFMQKQI